tara:strand:- start:2327 stop:2656 length:330 start_codon:yes stop_codon:yes gene_type:complete
VRYILRKFPTYGLPPEALVEVKNLSFSEAARWAHAEGVVNWIDPESRASHLSRSLAPPMPAKDRKVPLILREGDEALILAPARKHDQPKSVSDLRYTWIRVREISREAS